MRTRIALGIIIALLLGFAGSSDAKLYYRGNSMIWDSARNITWYDFAYQSKGDQDVSKYKGWDDANRWANNLKKTINGTVYVNWRLAKRKDMNTTNPCSGYYCKTSELGGLFYVTLKNKGQYDIYGNYQSGYGLKLAGPFTSFQPKGDYWLGPKDQYWLDRGGAWCFSLRTGFLGLAYKAYPAFAMAVHVGDIALPPGMPANFGEIVETIEEIQAELDYSRQELAVCSEPEICDAWAEVALELERDLELAITGGEQRDGE